MLDLVPRSGVHAQPWMHVYLKAAHHGNMKELILVVLPANPSGDNNLHPLGSINIKTGILSQKPTPRALSCPN